MTTEQTISPVEWVQQAARSKLLTRLLRPKQPAVLVISLPRSGSSR